MPCRETISITKAMEQKRRTKTQKRSKASWLPGLLFWLILWQLAAVVWSDNIFISSPWAVLKKLSRLIGQPVFWQTIAASFFRITLGSLVGMLLGFGLALGARKSRFLSSLLEPLVLVMRSVPVVSFIILLLIFVSSRYLALCITCIMVLPILYVNTSEGLRALDPKLPEMADVFHLNRRKRWRYILLPGLEPYLLSALSLASGLAWKAGVAAEVIGMPDLSIGDRLYKAKVYLDTSELFAWTLVLVLLSFTFSKLLLGLLKAFMKSLRKEKALPDFYEKKSESHKAEPVPALFTQGIKVQNLSKTFSDKTLFKNLNLSIPHGQVTAIVGPSGQGKTTLLKILLGLESMDEGQITGLEGRNCAVVFQEDRLLESFSVRTNIALAAKDGTREEDLDKALQAFGLMEDKFSPVETLSGGMKRRVDILRALLSSYDVLFLDEACRGLNSELKQSVIREILAQSSGKTLIFISHDREEIDAFSPDRLINIEAEAQTNA